MIVKEELIRRFVESVEDISNHGIVICPKSDGTAESEKMVADLAAMKIYDGPEDIADAIRSLADALERLKGE